MTTVFLFRVDGNKDNDDFFAASRVGAACAYAGVDFRVGRSGWIPDLVKVAIDDPPVRCTLTLIELEATESVALISCRKYLPEDSADIVAAFVDYLDRVVRQCRSTADPREAAIIRLKELLPGVEHVRVMTAGALRASASFVEELPLIDQPGHIARKSAEPQNGHEPARIFQGLLRLSQQQAQTMGRCIMILDAVIRGFDHSAATLGAWRAQDRSQPMKYLLAEDSNSYPALRALVFGAGNRGLTLDFEAILAELVTIWSDTPHRDVGAEHARALISQYFPVASDIRKHDKMDGIFESARVFLSASLT